MLRAVSYRSRSKWGPIPVGAPFRADSTLYFVILDLPSLPPLSPLSFHSGKKEN